MITCVEVAELFMQFSYLFVFIVVIIFIVFSCLEFFRASSTKEQSHSLIYEQDSGGAIEREADTLTWLDSDPHGASGRPRHRLCSRGPLLGTWAWPCARASHG